MTEQKSLKMASQIKTSKSKGNMDYQFHSGGKMDLNSKEKSRNKRKSKISEIDAAQSIESK